MTHGDNPTVKRDARTQKLRLQYQSVDHDGQGRDQSSRLDFCIFSL